MNINWTLVFQAISFLILLFLMYKFVYKPILTLMDERSKEIEDNLNNAEKMRTEAEKIKSDYEAMLKEAYNEADKIKREIEDAAQKEKNLIIAKGHEEVEHLREKMQKEIELEVMKVRNELRKEVVNLSVEIAEKILEREVDKKTNKEFIVKYLEGLGEKIEN